MLRRKAVLFSPASLGLPPAVKITPFFFYQRTILGFLPLGEKDWPEPVQLGLVVIDPPWSSSKGGGSFSTTGGTGLLFVDLARFAFFIGLLVIDLPSCLEYARPGLMCLYSIVSSLSSSGGVCLDALINLWKSHFS